MSKKIETLYVKVGKEKAECSCLFIPVLPERSKGVALFRFDLSDGTSLEVWGKRVK